jgi:FMN-dependent oxidoreductase (nitrilotriacetate monooxygenase family)
LSTPDRQLHLNLIVVATGRHDASWRLGGTDPRAFVDIDHFVRMARTAERGTMDGLFFADHHGGLTWGNGRRPWHALDPITTLTALAMATEHIGLIATQSALYGDPFTTARRMASLDHISHGRAAWNIVTSYDPSDAALYGYTAAPEDRLDRYAKADEYTQVVTGLWRSLDEDALVGDPEADVFVDLSKVHALDHVGEYFSVRGPLGMPQTPQGRPVLFHAGASPDSREFAARWADVLFTIQRTLEGAQDFYADTKKRAIAHGRNPEDLLIMPGLYVCVGSTEEEAKRRKRELDEKQGIHIQLANFAAMIGLPVEVLDVDSELPYELLDPAPPVGATTSGTAQAKMLQKGVNFRKVPASREQLIAQAKLQHSTVRELMTDSGGHQTIVGGPEQIADHMERWFTERGVDGFNLDVDSEPGGLEDLVEHVIPLLRKRGLFRHEYTGTTLRDTLGVPRP